MPELNSSARHNQISRRSALKIAGATLATTAVSTLGGSRSAHAANTGNSKRVIIAGAGIGGLSCAYELMKRGHDVTVLEASGRTCGHILTVHSPLADGLYADGGAEHFTKPGYEIYRAYVEEFGLNAIPYPRRKNRGRYINGKLYSEEMLRDREVLKKFGFNRKEVDFLAQHPWSELPSLYYAPYLDDFTDEYQPFGVHDALDHVSLNDLLKKDGASGTALSFHGGGETLVGDGATSALYSLWYAAILKLRGITLEPPELYRIEGGNQQLPLTFTAKLGDRVRLGCPVTHIHRADTGVTVTYKEYGEKKKMEADYLVNCIPLPAFSRIPVTPEWPEEKQFVIDNLTYSSYSRILLQSRTKFWEKDGLSLNMIFEDGVMNSSSQIAHEVPTDRGLVFGAGPAGVTGRKALASFRKHYPKEDTIEQAFVLDWSKDRWAASCERLSFPGGQLAKFWPNLTEPVGRVHFAGSGADNLNWGQEAATRSANRAAIAIDQA